MLDVTEFYNRAHGKIARLTATLLKKADRQGLEGIMDECEVESINVLAEIIDAVSYDEAGAQDLMGYAYARYELSDVPLSPFLHVTNTIIGTGGTGGVSSWNDLTDKPTEFPAIAHGHNDEDIFINLSGITETQGGIVPGDFSGNLQEFLEWWLIRYQSPSFTSFSSNLASTYEVGQEVSGAANLAWGILHSANVKNAANSGSITVSETGVLQPADGLNPFNLSQHLTGKAFTFTAAYKKDTIGTLTFTLNGINTNDVAMAPRTLSLNWTSRIYFGFAGNPAAVTAADIEADFDSTLTNTRNIQFHVAGAGHKVVWIPNIIAQAGINFYDPVNAFNIDMSVIGPLSVTNPQGLTLSGILYATDNFLNGALTIQIQ